MFFDQKRKSGKELSSIECRIIIRALLLLRESQIYENKTYDFIDDLIVKLCDLENDLNE